MFGLFSRDTKKLTLLLEVQSGLVRAALVGHTPQNPPKILYVTTHKIPTTFDSGSTRMVKMVLKAVHDVSEAILREALPHAEAKGYSKKSLKKVEYIFSSPWLISESKMVKISYPIETQISKEVVVKIVEDECNLLAKKYELADAENIEQKIFEVKLNGYPVTRFDGRKAKELEVSFATSVSSKKFLHRLRSEVNKVLHIAQGEYHSALLLQYNALRSLTKHKNEYIYAHIHDELTDIIMVKNGLCTQTSSLPFGAQTLMRKVALSLKEPLATTESTLSLLASNTLDPIIAQNINKSLSQVIQEWKLDFFTALTSTLPLTLVPRTIYLSAHTHFEIFRDIIVMENQFNFEIVSYDDMPEKPRLEFDRESEHSRMIEMYAFSFETMV